MVVEELAAEDKAEETQAIAADAQRDLNEALPALENAIKVFLWIRFDQFSGNDFYFFILKVKYYFCIIKSKKCMEIFFSWQFMYQTSKLKMFSNLEFLYNYEMNNQKLK